MRVLRRDLRCRRLGRLIALGHANSAVATTTHLATATYSYDRGALNAHGALAGIFRLSGLIAVPTSKDAARLPGAPFADLLAAKAGRRADDVPDDFIVVRRGMGDVPPSGEMQ